MLWKMDNGGSISRRPFAAITCSWRARTGGSTAFPRRRQASCGRRISAIWTRTTPSPEPRADD
ncbi:MAG: hypothetical protein H6685_01035 [Deltaproteobacteria bacterium]|nr:hypothetical protein [Deltaproteobacteria bacterium]